MSAAEKTVAQQLDEAQKSLIKMKGQLALALSVLADLGFELEYFNL